jgi:hypothetical protein
MYYAEMMGNFTKVNKTVVSNALKFPSISCSEIYPASRRWCVHMSIAFTKPCPSRTSLSFFQLLSLYLSLHLLLLRENTSFFALTSPCRRYKGHACSRVTPATDHALILGRDHQNGNFQRGKFPLLLPFAPALKEKEMEISQSLAPAPELEKDPIRVRQNRSCWQTLFVRIRFLEAMSPCFNSPRFSIVFQVSFHSFKPNRLSCLQA